MVDTVLTERIGRVLRIRIHRPEKKNALDAATYQGLQAAIETAEADPDIRVTLICGMPDCFTSGNDLNDFMAYRNSPEGWKDRAGAGFLPAIAFTRKPMIAAVSGPAIGVGTTMLLHCDLVFASDTARFQLSFVNLGLCPEAASSYLLPKRVGYAKAAELLLLAEPFSAQQALSYGLVNAVLPQDQLMDHAMVVAAKLSEKPAEAVRVTKALLKDRYRQIIADTMENERILFAQRLKSMEFEDAFNAFFKNRSGSKSDPA